MPPARPPRSAVRRVRPRLPRLLRPVARVVLLAAALLIGTAPGAAPATAQQPDTTSADSARAEADAGRQGPPRIGAFVYAEQGGAKLLVTPDTASSLNAGARLFLRCRGGIRELFVAVAGRDANLGSAREGAAGQFRMDRGPWSDLEQWGASEAGTAAFMNSQRVPTFVGRASGAGLAEIRIVNPAGVRSKFVFRMDGLEEALGRLPCMGG